MNILDVCHKKKAYWKIQYAKDAMSTCDISNYNAIFQRVIVSIGMRAK